MRKSERSAAVRSAASALCLLWLQSTAGQAQDALADGAEAPFSVTTNNGRVVERYGTSDNLAVVEYPAITNDVPMVEAFRTNNGRLFVCRLMSSQLSKAPKWAPEEGGIPLAARRAESIAIDRAFLDFGAGVKP